MDATAKILTPLQNNSSIAPRTFNILNNNLGGSAKHTKQSPKAKNLIHILSLISSPGSFSCLKTHKVFRRKNWKTTSLQQNYPSPRTTSAITPSKISQYILLLTYD